MRSPNFWSSSGHKPKRRRSTAHQVEARLADLPQEIAAGVDPAAVAKAMSENFRQQLAASGLQDTAALLKAAAITLKTLSEEITTTLKPIASIVSNETENLLVAAGQLEAHNTRLAEQQRTSRWLWQGLIGLVLFALGMFCGSAIQTRWTSDPLSSLNVHRQAMPNKIEVSKNH